MEPRTAAPSAWVRHAIAGVPPGGTVVDVACGSGRNLRLARSLGHPGVGIDLDLSGVQDLREDRGATLIAHDLEADGWPLPGQHFAGVIVTSYLWRALLPTIVDAVAPDGVLIYQTFAAGNERYGRPRRPEFLLEPGELLEACSGKLTVIAYRMATLSDPMRVVQSIVAVGPDHAWVTAPPAP